MNEELREWKFRVSVEEDELEFEEDGEPPAWAKRQYGGLKHVTGLNEEELLGGGLAYFARMMDLPEDEDEPISESLARFGKVR